MKASGVLLAALAAVAGAEKVSDSNMAKQIQTMLQSMSDNLESEGKAAKTTWALAKCQCDSDKDQLNADIASKSKATAESEADKEAARASANVASQQSAEARRNINQANADIEKADEKRSEQNSKFETQKGELTALMATLDDAIANLANAPTLLQTTAKKLRGGQWMDATRQMLQDIIPMMPDHQKAFIQNGGVDIQGTGANPQMIEQISLTLQGLKKQFAAQLEDATAQENMEQAAHDNWRAETVTMRTFNENLLSSAKNTMSDTDSRVQTADGIIDHEGIADLKNQLAEKTADCDFEEKRYNEHTQLRAQESAAVQQALSLLSSDDSKDLFKALDGHNERKEFFFIQTHASIDRYFAPQNAKATGANAKLDKVINKMDAQMEALTTSDNEDKAWASECKRTMSNLKKNLALSSKKITSLNSDLTSTKSALDRAETMVQTTSETMAELRKDMHDTTVAFNQTTAEYRAAYRDQTAALALLGKVVDALNQFYAADVRATHKGDASKDYEDQQDKGKGVVALLGDLQKEVVDRMKVEKTDQNDAVNEQYRYMNTTMDSLATTTASNSKAATTAANKKAEIEQLQTQLEDEEARHADLTQQRADNFPRCNFIKKTLQQRLDHRTAERDGLGAAKDALSGVKTL